MNLRITTRGSGTVTVVQIDGDLHQQALPELEALCASIEGPLCLDLVNLQSIDANGIAAIRTLEKRGAALAGISPYIERLLRSHA